MSSTRPPSRKGLSGLELNALSTIEEHRMLDAGHRVTVACSGGADSTALLMVMLNLATRFGWVISAAHFNHRLRGAESEKDERFVARLAKENDLEFFCARADVREVAAKARANLEATARKLRYEFFRALISEGKTDRVAVGHTADDQAETVLLRLIRGAGLRGLAAIRPMLPPGIIRPLLNVRGAQLRRWLTARSISWREDSSNQETRFRRNFLRKDIFPALSGINPSVVENLARTARLCQLDESFWTSYVSYLMERYTKISGDAIRVELSALRRLPVAASYRLLQQVVDSALPEETSSQYDQINSILHWAAFSKRLPLALPGNLAARKNSQHLIIAPKGGFQPEMGNYGSGYVYRLDVPGSIEDPRAGFHCRVEFVDLAEAREAYNKGDCVLLNQSLLKFPLTLRSWKPGDTYRLHGRHKSRKLKELFQRHKVPRVLRFGWPVLESDSQIVWAKEFGVAQGLTPRFGDAKAVLFTYRSLDASK